MSRLIGEREGFKIYFDDILMEYEAVHENISFKDEQFYKVKSMMMGYLIYNKSVK